MKRRQWVSITLAGAMAAVMLGGCGGSSSGSSSTTTTTAAQAAAAETTEVDYGGTELVVAEGQEESELAEAEAVSVAIGNDIPDLQPWSSATSGRQAVLPTIYECMAYYDSDSESGMTGILMKDYEKIDNYTSRVTIYDYIHDSAGNPITAEDVAFSFNEWKTEGKSVKCKLLDSCEAVDDYTVEIKLSVDTVGDIENMLCGLIPIVSKTAYEADGNKMTENVVSTAPYIVTEYVAGSHLTVVKNEDYWQTEESLILPVSQANAKEITFHVVTEKSQVSVNLETNVVDIAVQMANSEVTRFEGNADYTAFPRKDVNFYWITFNCAEGSVFDGNAALRQAICYAIDENGLVTGAVSGRGEACKAFGNPECVDYNSKWDSEEYYEYDVEKAKELLSESGFDSSNVIRIMARSTDVPKSAAQIIQSYLLQIGVNSEILNYEEALFQSYKTEPTEWDIMLDSKQSLDYVTSLASTFQVSGETQALNFVQDDKLQEMVISVQTNAGHTEEAIDEYMQYLKDQCYVYALFRGDVYDVAESTVAGVFRNFKGWLVPGACSYTVDFER